MRTVKVLVDILPLAFSYLGGALVAALVLFPSLERMRKRAEDAEAACKIFDAGFTKAQELLGTTKKKLNEANATAARLTDQLRRMSER